MEPKKIVVILGIILSIIIMLQNTQAVTIKLLFWDLNFPLIVMIILTTLIGFVTGYLINSIKAK